MYLDENDIIGTGGMSVVYKMSDALAVKVFRQGITLVDVQHEYDMAHLAYDLGLPTPKPHDVVTIGSQHGIIYDLLKGCTLSQALTDHPDRIDDYAMQMSELYHTFHSTKIKTSNPLIPSAYQCEENAIHRITPIIGADGAQMLLAILRTVPEGNSLIHSDLHPRNIMLQDDRLMVIDMGEVGYGNPAIDIAHVHALMTSGLIDIKRFMGFPAQYAQPLWHTVLKSYYRNLSPEEYTHTIHTLDIQSLIRCFTWLAVSDGLPQEVITRFQRHFEQRVTLQWRTIEDSIKYRV